MTEGSPKKQEIEDNRSESGKRVTKTVELIDELSVNNPEESDLAFLIEGLQQAKPELNMNCVLLGFLHIKNEYLDKIERRGGGENAEDEVIDEYFGHRPVYVANIVLQMKRLGLPQNQVELVDCGNKLINLIAQYYELGGNKQADWYYKKLGLDNSYKGNVTRGTWHRDVKAFMEGLSMVLSGVDEQMLIEKMKQLLVIG